MFGVSPAYFISRFSDRFSCRDIARCLPDIRASGFDMFQPEVFHAADLDAWRSSGAALIGWAARASGLGTSQTVGHCLLHAFETPEALASDFGLVETEMLLEGMRRLTHCDVLTVAIPPFRPSAAAQLTAGAWAGFRARFTDKLGRMLELAERSGCRLALEVLPGSLVGGTEGFLRLHAELGSAALGYNFDTGNAWAAREWVPLVPAQLGSRIFGTHLKDNTHDEQALGPGKGSIPWRETLAALRAAGYTGSLDVELRCAAELAVGEYEQALAYLRPLVH